MAAKLRKYWLFVGLGVVIVLAFAFPRLGDALRDWYVLKIGIFLAFFTAGLTLETGAIMEGIRNVKGLAAAMISCFVIFPVLAYGLARIVAPGNDDLLVGACLLGVAPVTVASGVVMTQMARGNVSLSLLIDVATNMVSIFTIPLSLAVLLGAGKQVHLPVSDMILTLFIIALLPTVLGQLLRARLKDVIVAWRKRMSIFNQLVVLMIVFNAVSKSSAQIITLGAGLIMLLGFAVVIHVLALAINYGLARLLKMDLPSTAAMTIHTSQKTLTVSFIIWSGYFAAAYPTAFIPVIVYHVSQLLIDTAVAHRFRLAADRLEQEASV